MLHLIHFLATTRKQDESIIQTQQIRYPSEASEILTSDPGVPIF